MKNTTPHFLVTGLLLIAAFSACSGRGGSAAGSAPGSTAPVSRGGSVNRPLPPEKNPPGDIPDTQVFTGYVSSQGGYTLDVPEAWARTSSGTDVEFTFHFDGVSVTITSAPTHPGAEGIRAVLGEKLKATGEAVAIRSVRDVLLPGGPAVLMLYESNSEPKPVTNKKVRLETNSYFFYRDGKLAELRLWAPQGADNVDQWQRIAASFRWQ